MTRVVLADRASSPIDLGEGTVLPTVRSGGATLVRGDVYRHTGLGCLMIWNGVGWRQVHLSGSQPAALAATYPTALHFGFQARYESILYEWDGIRWVKVGGLPELIYAHHTAGGFGNFGEASMVSREVKSVAIPAHSAGILRFQSIALWWSAGGQAVHSWLYYGGTAWNSGATEVPGSRHRSHNSGYGQSPAISEGYLSTDGTAKTLRLVMAAEAVATTSGEDSSFRVWLV